MKRGFIIGVLFLSLFLTLSVVHAEVTVQDKSIVSDVIVKELSQPAKFTLTLKNDRADTEYVEFVTYVDAILAPRGAIAIDGLSTKQIDLDVFVGDKLRNQVTGSYTFVYYIKSQAGVKEDRLIIRLLPLKDVLSLESPSSINSDASSLTFSIKNNESVVLNNVIVSVKGAFVDAQEEVSLSPASTQEITVPVNAEKLSTTLTGSYAVTFSIDVNKESSLKLEKEIFLQESKSIVTEEKNSGSIFAPVLTITKTNNGNSVAEIDVVADKNIFGGFFSSFNINPDSTEKTIGLFTWRWHATLSPGESLTVEIRTNYTSPLIILALIFVAVLAFYLLFRGDVVITKKATRVMTKGGEFALKVVLFVKARRNVSGITVRDRLPAVTNLHERFGSLHPSKVDNMRNLVEWSIESMAGGEEHIFSYIMYSKVNILGRFELPRGFVLFKDAKGKQKSVLSNSVYYFEEHKTA